MYETPHKHYTLDARVGPLTLCWPIASWHVGQITCTDL